MLLQSQKFDNFFIGKNLSFLNDILFEDKIILSYILMKHASNESDESIVADIWMCIYLENEEKFLDESIIQKCFINSQYWKQLVNLCDKAKIKGLENLFNHIIEKLFDQLIIDMSIYDKKAGKKILKELTLIHETDPELISVSNRLNLNQQNNLVSNMTTYLPRINNAIDKRSRIARELANLINCYKNTINESDLKKKKITSYNR